MRRPGPQARKRLELGGQFFQRHPRVQIQRPIRRGRREGVDALHPPAGHAQSIKISGCQCRRRWKAAELAERAEFVGPAVAGGDPPRDRARGRDRHLLSDDHANRCLETVPGARDPDMRQAPHERAEHRIFAEDGRRRRVVERKEPPDPCHVIDQGVQSREMSCNLEVPAAGPNLDQPRIAAGHRKPPVRSALHLLHPRYRTRGEITEQLLPLERPLAGHAEADPSISHQDIAFSPAPPKNTRRETECLLHHAVHLAPVREAGGATESVHRKVGLVEQASGEVSSARTRDEGRRGTDGLLEQPPELARRVTHAGCKLPLGVAVEEALADQYEGPLHRQRGPFGGCLCYPLRPAPQAGPEPRCLGGHGRPERFDIPRIRPPGATRPAVDARCLNRLEMHALIMTDPVRRIRTRCGASHRNPVSPPSSE